MKGLLIIIGLFAGIQVNAQQLTRESGTYTYHQVVRVTGEKTELFKKAEEWVKQSHTGSEAVIQYADEAKGQIIVKGLFDPETKKRSTLNKVAYICTIQFRNGMYKESYENFRYVKVSGEEIEFESKSLKGKSDIIKTTDVQLATLSTSLKEHLTTALVASK